MPRMKITLLFTLVITFALSAFAVVPNRKTSAAAVKTFDIYAPLYRQHDITLHLGLPFGTIDGSPNGSKSKVSGYLTRLGYAYGITDYISVYVIQNYQSTDQSQTNPTYALKINGPGDTTLGIKSVISFDKPYFYYSASYKSALLDKAKVEGTATSGQQTSVTTRPDIAISGGAGIPYSYFSFGALVAYHLLQDGDFESTTSGVKTTQKYRSGTGLDLKIYAQLELGWKLGVSYEEDKTDSYNIVTSGVSSVIKDSTYTAITGYGIIPFGFANEVLVGFSKFDNKEATTTKYDIYSITLAYRKIF
ncbi:MAG: hypothetical protein H7328_09095 [Bdellovibrio sp.]|nr:hypothetical protein [Bdellovibrio sp.]